MAVSAIVGSETDAALAQSTQAPTRDELEGRTAPETPPQPSRLTVEGGIERAPCPLADPRYSNVNVNFSAVEFTNLKGASPAGLQDSWQEFAGRDVSIATVCEIRDRAATKLRRDGYLAAVQVVPQEIQKGGTLRFDVLMAKLVSVQVRGDAGASEKTIASYLEKLTEQPLFNVKEAERYLLLVRDLPGFDVRLTLRPAGTVPGEVAGEVTLQRQTVELAATVQNYGSHDVGRWGAIARLQLNGLTGMGDSTYASLFNTFDTSEQTIVQAGHSFLLNSEGLRATGDFTYAWTHPTLAPNSPIRSRTLIGSAKLTYPFIRSQSSNVSGSIGFELVNQKVRFVAVPLSTDRLRVLFARFDFSQIDPKSFANVKGYSVNTPRWLWGGSIEFRQGVSLFNGSKPCGAGFVNCIGTNIPISRSEADPTALLVRGEYDLEYRPTPLLAISLAPRFQYSSKPLLSFEEFTAGNYTVGRGFDAGTLLGDSGIGLKAELRYGTLIPKSNTDVMIQPFAFYDSARVWNKDRIVIAGVNGPQQLYSAGGGIRAAWGNRARLEATIAAPLTRAGLQTRKGDVRALMSLTIKALPWR